MIAEHATTRQNMTTLSLLEPYTSCHQLSLAPNFLLLTQLPVSI